MVISAVLLMQRWFIPMTAKLQAKNQHIQAVLQLVQKKQSAMFAMRNTANYWNILCRQLLLRTLLVQKQEILRIGSAAYAERISVMQMEKRKPHWKLLQFPKQSMIIQNMWTMKMEKHIDWCV